MACSAYSGMYPSAPFTGDRQKSTPVRAFGNIDVILSLRRQRAVASGSVNLAAILAGHHPRALIFTRVWKVIFLVAPLALHRIIVVCHNSTVSSSRYLSLVLNVTCHVLRPHAPMSCLPLFLVVFGGPVDAIPLPRLLAARDH